MSTGELEAGRPRLPVAAVESTVAIPSPWRIAWRRFLRDRVAVASGIFLMPAWAVFVVRRLASSILLLLLLLTLITFVVFSRIPSDPAAFLIDLRYATPARLENAGHVLGADKPIFVQYGRFVWRALHGDLGRSYRQQRGGFTVPSSTGTRLQARCCVRARSPAPSPSEVRSCSSWSRFRSGCRRGGGRARRSIGPLRV